MPSETRRQPDKARRSGGIGAGLTALAAGAGVLAVAGPAAGATPTETGLLHQGSVGPGVAKVQHALHTRATGRFSSATKRAVLVFQRRDGLLVDGIVGPQTWDALFGITPSQPATSTQSSSPGASSSTATGGYTVPSSIVQCESGGNYSAVNSSSGAGGAYQIMPSTWQAYGGQGLPQDAPKSEQDRIAAAIYANQGSSAWSC
jgi:peptidoglycan hydrolase-like protein with peptidoglycan-binding domain